MPLAVKRLSRYFLLGAVFRLITLGSGQTGVVSVIFVEITLVCTSFLASVAYSVFNSLGSLLSIFALSAL